MQDALIVLRSAIPPIELLLCSSYFSLADVQEALTAYDGELLVMVAVPGLMNTVRRRASLLCYCRLVSETT